MGPDPNSPRATDSRRMRAAGRYGAWLAAAVIVLLVGGYAAGVVTGRIPESRRLDGTTLALIALATAVVGALLVPNLFEQLRRFELAGFKLEMRDKVNQLEQAVSEQDRRINMLLQTAMSDVIFKHLCGIALCRTYLYQDVDLFQREIYYLKDHGLIRLRPGHETVEFNPGFDQCNIVDVAIATEAGWQIIRLRIADIPEYIRNDPALWNREAIPADVLQFLAGA